MSGWTPWSGTAPATSSYASWTGVRCSARSWCPGVTACLRCIDAHQSVRDPDHVAVTARYVRATARVRPDGVPDIDPALAALALAWAARDVVAHLDGREPSTWSRTLVLSAEPARRDEHEWRRHPQCGCCW